MQKTHSLIYETVLDIIKTQLLDGTYKLGDRLPTAVKMAKKLQVGQASVREAYRVLELIFDAAHNPVLSKMLSALNDMFLDSRRLTSRLSGATEKAILFHQLIARTIKEHKPDTARVLMYGTYLGCREQHHECQ